jgi:hypothetical protein
MELKGQSRISHVVEESAFLLRYFLGRSPLGSHQMKTAQSDHDRDEIDRLAYLSAERLCLFEVLS